MLRQPSSARLSVIAAAVVAITATGACDRAASNAQGVAPAPASLASAQLTDHDGRTWSFGDLRGKLVVLGFFFTSCPTVCPRATQALAEVQRLVAALEDRVHFVSLSVDPENDTPDVMRRFGLAHGADLRRWSFVRGDARTTRTLAQELAAFEGPSAEQAAPWAHTTAVYLFDASGRLRQRYAGSPLDVSRLARELEQLHASIGKSAESRSIESASVEVTTLK